MGLNGASAVEDGTTQTLVALLWLAGSLTFLANAFGRAWRTTDMMSGSSHSGQRSGTRAGKWMRQDRAQVAAASAER